MGLKHGKYVYVKRSDGWYVKVRVLKGAPSDRPEKYLVVGPRVRVPPLNARVLLEAELPEEARKRLYEV